MHTFVNNSTYIEKSLLLRTEHANYMFGIPEGVQTLCNKMKASLKSIKYFIVSSKKELVSLIGVCHSFLEIEIDVHVVHSFLSNPEIEYLQNSILPGKVFFHQKVDEKCCKISQTFAGWKIEFMPLKSSFDIRKLTQIDPEFPKKYIKLLKNSQDVVHGNKTYKSEDFISKTHIKPIIVVPNIVEEFPKDLINECNKCEIIFCYNKETIETLKELCTTPKILYVPNKDIFDPSMLKFRDCLNRFEQRLLFPQENPSNQPLNELKSIDEPITFDKKRVTYISNHCHIFEDDHILFLGTGSAVPTKHRNVSGCMLNIKEKIIFLDCGEGTINQLFNSYGSITVLKNLSAIIISHTHADHFLGMFSIIDFVYKAKNKPITVIGPKNLVKFIKFFEYDQKISFIEANGALDVSFDGIIVKSCAVEHRIYSNAYAIEIDGRKFSYSGDCRPSKEFAELANKSDVMIHEATFKDEMKEDAIRTQHSTYSEALDVFKESKSKKLILTHFSQRYKKTVDFPLKNGDVIIAYDMMVYNFKRMKSDDLKKHIQKNFPE